MMIGYTVPEIRRLLAALFVRRHQPKHIWWWSHWRRRRQHQARLSHYKRRGYGTVQITADLDLEEMRHDDDRADRRARPCR
jgi:hypothetical protein